MAFVGRVHVRFRGGLLRPLLRSRTCVSFPTAPRGGSFRRLAQVRCSETAPGTPMPDVMAETSTEGVAEMPQYTCTNCGASLSLADTKCQACNESFPATYKEFVNRVVPKKQGGWELYIGQEMFRLSLMSYIYERGWRQTFMTYGFPGPDKEFDRLVETLKENNLLGGLILDVSCGSGFTARKMVESGLFSRVVALDYSEAMLRETKTRFDKEGLDSGKIDFIRADVVKLPFATGSVPAIHNGASIHTYPSVQDSLIEMRRVLADGGILFGTTVDKTIATNTAQRMVTRNFRFFGNRELYNLLKGAGFENPIVENIDKCLLFIAKK